MEDEGVMNDGSKIFATSWEEGVFRLGPLLDADILDALLLFAFERKASEITLQPDQPVWFEVAGRNIPATDRLTTSSEVENIVRHLGGENGPAEIFGASDLDPSYEVSRKGVAPIRFRVNVTGGRMVGGIGMQISIRPLASLPPQLDSLDVEQDIVDNYRPKNGLVLVTGPTGSGKTTLLSSLVRHRLEGAESHERIIEFAKPIEFVYDEVEKPTSMVFQTEVWRHLRPRGTDRGDEGEVWAYMIRNAMRRKPTIIIVGEARDRASISAVCEAAQTGHLVYATMHTIGVAETLRRMIASFPGGEREAKAIDIMEVMRMLVTQILVPRVGGGKVAVREYMVFTQDIREQFLKADPSKWPLMTRRMLLEGRVKGRTLKQALLEKLVSGAISKDTFKHYAAGEGN